jgi:hypothetical protein
MFFSFFCDRVCKTKNRQEKLKSFTSATGCAPLVIWEFERILTQKILYNKNMSKKTRLVFAVLILLISLSMLVWASLPAFVERRVLPIPPGDLQLPTPSAMIFERAV